MRLFWCVSFLDLLSSTEFVLNWTSAKGSQEVFPGPAKFAPVFDPKVFYKTPGVLGTSWCVASLLAAKALKKHDLIPYSQKGWISRVISWEDMAFLQVKGLTARSSKLESAVGLCVATGWWDAC